MAIAELYLVELLVLDRKRLVQWYVEVMGLNLILDDPNGDFSLLATGSCRIAIKGGRNVTSSSSLSLMFRVENLDLERSRLHDAQVEFIEVEEGTEGYRAIKLKDPSGHPIQLFQWINPDNDLP